MNTEYTVFSLALMYFLVANPVGNAPAVMAMLKDYDFDRQRKIVLREGIISLIIALFFLYCGKPFLKILNISEYALSITGGLILFMVAMGMIFHQPEVAQDKHLKQEPFIVPIAIPLISGPGLMSTIMITGTEANNMIMTSTAVAITFAGVILVMVSAPYIQRLAGKEAMAALEQVMGMILGLISMNLIVKGAFKFVETLS